MELQENYTYILRCADGTLYTGWTNNLEKRIQAHNSGEGAKYTKSRTPVELAYFELHTTKEEAMKREYEIKQLSRSEKEMLIAGTIDIKQGQSYNKSRAKYRKDIGDTKYEI